MPRGAASSAAGPGPVSTPSHAGAHVTCQNCEEKEATVACQECDQKLCDSCNSEMHLPARLKSHVRMPLGGAQARPPALGRASSARPATSRAPSVTPPEATKLYCEQCTDNPVTVSCASCSKLLCGSCDARLHAGAMAGHSRTPAGVAQNASTRPGGAAGQYMATPPRMPTTPRGDGFASPAAAAAGPMPDFNALLERFSAMIAQAWRARSLARSLARTRACHC
jgi:hypothetical protein